MSVWHDMAKDAGMEPIDQAAAWIEESERRKHEEAMREDSWCDDCQKPLSEHDLCARSDVRPDGCGHYTCDCICDFIRDEWPTHPANPEARS